MSTEGGVRAYPDERMIERMVTYTIKLNGRLHVVENVPARVNVETGERCFSSETLTRLQRIILGSPAPESPV